MKKLIVLTMLLYVVVVNAKDQKLVASCMMPLENTVKAASCSNFELENENDRNFIDGMCKIANGIPSKGLCPTGGIEAVCVVRGDSELVESYYYGFSSSDEIDAEEQVCETSMQGEFEVM